MIWKNFENTETQSEDKKKILRTNKEKEELVLCFLQLFPAVEELEDFVAAVKAETDNAGANLILDMVAGDYVDVKPGNAMPLGNIPVGTIVHNIETKIGKGGQLARSAGTYAQIVGRDQDYVILRLSTSEQRLVHGRCMATVGAVSNPDNMNQKIGKAGRKRHMGVRPQTRGTAMNPVDHPHGGRTNGGMHPVSPWGTPTKGYKTRRNKRTDVMIVRRRNATKG